MTPGAPARGRGPVGAGSAGALASTAARRGLLMASPDEPATGGVAAGRASTGAVVPGRIAMALPSAAGAVGWVSVATGVAPPALSAGLTSPPIAAGPPPPRAAPLAAPNREASTAWRPRYV